MENKIKRVDVFQDKDGAKLENFDQIRRICEFNSVASRKAVDEFMLHYAAEWDRLDRAADQALLPYRHITRKMPGNWVNLLRSQFIAHRVFKKDGLLSRYLNHSRVKTLDDERKRFLIEQLEFAWRFSFASVVANPERDFFRMEDIFSGETYLLYSPGLREISLDKRPNLWFNLVAFNGACYQSYGPIAYFRGFETDDLFFFATEQNSQLEDEDDILQDIERNFFPYAMLFSGGDLPFVFHKKDQVLFHNAEYPIGQLNIAGRGDRFIMAEQSTVKQLRLKRWAAHPHFATAYWDGKNKSLFLSAATGRGFKQLVKALKEAGCPIDEEADVRLNPAMKTTAGEILKKEISTDPYAQLFSEPADPAVQAGLDSLNYFLQLALPYVNSGREPDHEALAREAGVDPDSAKQILKAAIERARQLIR